MLIKTFWSAKKDKQTCDVVSVGMLLKDGGLLELSLRTVPLICEPVSGQPLSQVTESYEYLSKLKLAEKEWKPFVQNRANEIRRLLPAQIWKHCFGKDNPTDLPSCGVAYTDLVRNN